MLSRSILIRGACVGLMLTGLFAVADGLTRAQLAGATEALRSGGVDRVAAAAE